jgi:hypothetical protein
MIDNYNKITLGLYLEVDAVLQDKGADDLDKQVRIIALLDGTTPEAVLTLPLKEYSAKAAATDFLRHECPPVSAPSRVISGDFVLIPTKDFTTITTAQYVDFQTFSKGGTAKLPELIAVLLVPEGHNYNDGYDVAKVVRVVRDLPLPMALGLSAFFFGQLVQSIQASLTSLESAAKSLPKRRRAELERKAEDLQGLLRGVGLHV